MTARAAALRGQRMAEAMMRDTGILARPGVPVTDPVTGAVTDDAATIYTGRCKITSDAAVVDAAEAGQATVLVTREQVHIPHGAPRALAGDTFEVTASVDNPHNVGRRFRVLQPVGKTFETAQRLPVQEIQ